jgi:uncharacterized protein (DUF1778 family)
MPEIKIDNKPWTITYKQIGVIILSFSLGLISALLLQNAGTTQASTFTTTELIGFVLSVIVSGASMVLAVAAIALGRSSEQAVITRSDESIRLQNEVFTKTTEALQRIEASTGVTEKRIEDIIAGRVGDISHQIAQMASKGGKQSPKDLQELEENIRRSLLSSIRDDDKVDRRHAFIEKRQRDEAEKAEKARLEQELEDTYQAAHQKTLLNFGNKKGVTINKLEHGSPSKSGEDLFDGLFTYQERSLGVSTFRPDSSEDMLKIFILNASSELAKNTIDELYIVAFTDNNDSGTPKVLDEAVMSVSAEIKERIHILPSDIESAAKVIADIKLSNKAQQTNPLPAE